MRQLRLNPDAKMDVRDKLLRINDGLPNLSIRDRKVVSSWSDLVMVDSLKNATALGTAVTQTQAGDSLRKNLKTISSVSVKDNSPPAPERTSSDTARAEKAVSGLADSVHLSADAIRTLVSIAESSGDEVDLVEENIRAASATPEDVQTATESARRTGSAISFRREEALQAHGNRLSAQRVQQLLTE